MLSVDGTETATNPVQDDAAELQGANLGSEQAPDSSGVTPCQQQKEEEAPPANIVRPVLNALECGWFHTAEYKKGAPARFEARLTESEESPPYAGSGTLTFGAELRALFRDAACAVPLANPLPLSDLKAGTPFYARFAGTETAHLTLTLAPSDNPLIDVQGPEDALLRVKPVNVVQPYAENPVNGWVRSDDALKFKAASVELRVTQSQAEPVYAGEATVTVEGGEAKLFLDENGLRPLPPKLPFKEFPLRVFVKPVKPLKLKLKLALDDPADARMLVMPLVSADVEIEPVTLVQAKVEVTGAEAWFDPEVEDERYNKPAQVTVSIVETGGGPQYEGQGTVTVAGGNVLRRAGELLAGPISAADLRGGVALTVHGATAGEAAVLLTLAPSDHPRIVVNPEDSKPVRVQQVVKLTPEIRVTTEQGWFGELLGKPHPASFLVQLIHSDESRVLPQQVAIVASNGAALFEDEAYAIPLAAKIDASRLLKPLPVYVKGTSPGDVRLTVTPTVPGDGTFRLALTEVAALVKMASINVVKPAVKVETETGWLHAPLKLWQPAAVRVRIEQGNPLLPYGGGGVLSCAGGELFLDEAMTEPAARLSAEQMAGVGKLVYVKGTAAGDPAVKVTLEASGDLRIVTAPKTAEAPVKIKPMNVVTPKITAECKVILVNNKVSAHQLGPEAKVAGPERTKIELSIEESEKAPAYSKTGTLTVPDHVKVYTTPDKDVLFDLKTKLTAEALRKKTTVLYLEGERAGECEVKLLLEKDETPGVHAVAEALENMVAVKLDLVLYAIARADPWPETAMSETDKINVGRVLHVQDAAKYSRGKIVIKKPDDALWKVGGDGYKLKIEVAALSGSGQLFAADTGGAGAATLELDKAAFGGGDKSVWLEGNAAVTALRGMRVHLGLSGTKIKRYGDWAAFTIVKIDTVSPTVGAYKQEVRKPVLNALHPGTLGPEYEAEVKLSVALTGIDINYKIIPDANNAKYPELPREWMFDDPVIPNTAKTDGTGTARKLLKLSRLKAGLYGYHGNHFVIGAYLADDPVKGLAEPIKGKDIEIDAPAGACGCCGKPVGHSAGVPISQMDWYEELNFSSHPDAVAYRPTRGAYQAGMVNIANRGAAPVGPCQCPSPLAVANPPPLGIGTVTRDLLPRGGCSHFAPVSDDEYHKVIRDWDNSKKKNSGYPKANGIDGRYPNQMDRQCNHLVPKSAAGCPTGHGNLQVNGWLCPHCQGLDAPMTNWQGRRNPR